MVISFQNEQKRFSNTKALALSVNTFTTGMFWKKGSYKFK